MATSNNALKVADLDFFSIKNNLKDFLRNQSEFTDYDFDGSGMSVLLDLLAYNTYYNGFYLNMVANEAFLDTAQMRQNILSHAKVIGYVPQSKRGAWAKVNVRVTPSQTEDQNVSYIILDRYTRLLGQDIDGVNYPFVTVNANSAQKVGSSFYFANVVLKQGEVVTRQFPASANNVKRRYEIPSQNVDTSTISVTVQESSTNTHTTEYTLFEDLTEVRANSTVYFVEENENLNYTIYFGDDIIGKKPANGNIITVTYLDTQGSKANNISGFRFVDYVGQIFRDNVSVTSIESSYGGTDKETEEQIQFRAPYAYTAQNRAVTENDYYSLLSKDYNNIDAISVWGGEENDPPNYGKVYISIKTKGMYRLSNLEKESIINDLIKNRNVMTVTPEILDPDYCFVIVNGRVTFDAALTNKTASQINSVVNQAIVNYTSDELNTFNSTFRKSKLQQYIEASDPSITGSDLEIYLQKQIDVYPLTTRNYYMDFNTQLRKGSFSLKLYSFPTLKTLDINGITREVYFEEVTESITGIGSIKVINKGRNYTSSPTITIVGDGTGATATAIVINGQIDRINVVNRGVNYTRATVVIADPDGIYGQAEAILESRYGKLRTYYYKITGEKVIVDDYAGDIDYLTGKVTLLSLYTSGTANTPYYANNVLTINTLAERDIIEPMKNRILTIDTNNAQSIQIEMVAES